MTLPRVPLQAVVEARLTQIFPDGTPERQWCVRLAAVRTVLTLFYAGAIDGSGRWIKPNQVVSLSDEQLACTGAPEREDWYKASSANRWTPTGAPWYASNSREQVRDEGLKKGLIPNGAVIERPVAVTSSAGRYALEPGFAALFDASLDASALDQAVERWQVVHLSNAARARIALIRSGATASNEQVEVSLPNGASVVLAPGPSSLLTKALVEQFAPRYLHTPSVLWLSESGNKIVDPRLANALGLKLDPALLLPDAILADVGAGKRALIVFCEVVHSDGPITEQRRELLLAVAESAGFDPADLAFITVFRDRSDPAYRARHAALAWNTFVWFASEPDAIVALRQDGELKLSQLR